jgi:uncharacterized protein (DUF58 family)
MKIDVSFLKEIDRFRIVLKQRVLQKYQGEQQSTLSGGGLVFKDHTMYAPGDDIRHIDWNVYARTERLFIRRFEEEKNMITHIVLDASSSMNFGQKIKKFEYAAMVGLGFAYLTAKENGRFNFATFSDDLQVIRSDHGKNIMKIVSHLNNLKIGGKTNLVDSMEKYKKNIQSKSMIVIVSDFLYDINDIKEILLRYKRNNIHFIQVLDPIELNMTLKGDVVLKDMESSDYIKTYISNRLRNTYKHKLHEHMMEIKDLCEKFNASFITASTDETVFDTFYRILFRKRHVRR